MPMRYRFGSKKRDALWARERNNAQLTGRGDLPICNLCNTPVGADQAWHESHLPWRGAPVHLRSVGVAHKDCNLEHGRKVVVPAVAQSNRLHKRDQRAANSSTRQPTTFSGSGRYRMAGGITSPISRSMKGRVVRRLSRAEKQAAFVAKRGILTQQQEA